MKDFHRHLPDAPNLEKVMSTFQIIQTRSWLSLPKTGRAAELRPKPTYFSGNDSRPTPNTFAEHLTELLASAHHWNRKHFLPRKHIFSTENSQTRDPLLFTEQKACAPARGGEKERGKNLHGSYASSLGARPSLRPRAPGHFPSHPPRSRSCKLREAGSMHVNQPGPPASRLHLPSPPPKK